MQLINEKKKIIKLSNAIVQLIIYSLVPRSFRGIVNVY